MNSAENATPAPGPVLLPPSERGRHLRVSGFYSGLIRMSQTPGATRWHLWWVCTGWARSCAAKAC